MGVPLNHFGYYQGALSLTFAIVCIISPKAFEKFGQKLCLYFGLGTCCLSAILTVGLVLLQVHQPLVITAVVVLFSVGLVFPINFLYPYSLEVIPNTKGRSAGLGQAILLLLTASLLELVGYFYNGKFMPIGLAMIISIIISLVLIQRMMSKKWLILAKVRIAGIVDESEKGSS